MGLFKEWISDTGSHREIVIDCPECKGMLVGHAKHITADSKGSFFRCRWCGAKIYQQDGFDGFVDDDGNPLEDDYDPMLTPVDPLLYDPSKKIIKAKGPMKIQRSVTPNSKQSLAAKKPVLKAYPKWDEDGFDYSPTPEVEPNKLYAMPPRPGKRRVKKS